MTSSPYMSATIAMVLVVLLSLLSAIMVLPLLNKSFSKHILSLLTMLAVGCLCGDAVFHLIPHSLGIDKTTVVYVNVTENGNGESRTDLPKDPTIVAKCALVIISIYLFYLLNNIMNFCQIGHTHSHGHSHSIPYVNLPINDDALTSCQLQKGGSKSKQTQTNNAVHYTKDEECARLLESKPIKNDVTVSQVSYDSKVSTGGGQLPLEEFSFRKVPKVVWMLYIGGVLHNVTDGLAVGASFAGSFPGGISTTLAILFHEIPHAIGDFVVLLSSGLKAKVAISFISSTYIASFIGCYTGVALGTELNIVDWIFAVTAGMFLYIALVELLPETIDDAEERGPRHIVNFVWQNVGFFIGAGIMALIAAYEDRIKSVFTSK